jgi:RNA polymerase sigma factor (sigma-70 family)
MTAALTDVFLSHRKSLIWSVMRIVRDSQAAEDVAQETYIRASKAIENGPVEYIEAFLFQTARNLALNHKRHRDMRNGIEREDVSEDDIANVAASIPSPETALIHRQRLHCVDAAMTRLPERARTVWLLSRIEKWSYPKIAEHLGVSPNTVFNDLKLAHAHCLDALAKIDRD